MTVYVQTSTIKASKMKKIFISIKHYEDYKNRDCIDAISSLLEKRGFQTICLARDYENWGEKRFSPEDLMEIAIQHISTSLFVLVETTTSGTGLGVEAGYAYAKKIPVITIAKENTEIPLTLQGISCQIYKYKHYEDLDIFFDSVLTQNNTHITKN